MKCETDGNPQPQFDFIKNVSANFVPCAQCVFIWVLLSLLLILCLFHMQDVTLQSGPELLVLHNVTRNSSGTYKCEALDFDAIDVDLTKTLTINVHRE